MSEKIFITMPNTANRDKYFPPDCLLKLKRLGEVSFNPHPRKLTEEELCDLAPDCTVLFTHWGTPQITSRYLGKNKNLKLIAHGAGTVAHIASEDTYQAHVPCLSANPVMAKYVAEGVLGLIIASLRGYKEFDRRLSDGEWQKETVARSLFDVSVGLVGLGTVGRNLLDMLTVFGTKVKVYDPYLKPDALCGRENVALCSFDEVIKCDVVSIHASQTPETYHIINADAFEKMIDGAVLINTARGSLVDTAAAEKYMRSGKIRAAIDVYEKEGCAQPVFAGMDGVIIQPHTAALPAGAFMTREIIDDIYRFLQGGTPKYKVEYEQFLRMTQE